MALEFPSVVNAMGRVAGDAITQTSRGATVARLAVGDYVITMERGLGIEQAICLITPAAAAVVLAPTGLSQNAPDSFTFVMRDSAGVAVDSDFFYAVLAIDESS